MGELRIPVDPKVLVVGGGAREHAIVWKLAQSPLRPQLFAAPGNPGIAQLARCVEIATNQVDELMSFIQEQQIDFVVIGPEQPLELGLADRCAELGIPAFGPSQAAARLETSKSFAKDLMQQAGVPSAAYAVFTDADEAKAYAWKHGAPIVVKADGLAAGKGVTVAMSLDDAIAAIDDIMLEKRFGAAGAQVVLESFLEGPEVSLMFFVDGDTVVPMLPARDHKRAYDDDQGPNTGGMGAFAPVSSFLAAAMTERVEAEIVRPTLAALRDQGIVYRGVLYVGLMMTANGPYVIEFNARFGDPETEAVLPLLETDLLEVTWAAATGRLGELPVKWSEGAAVCVVLAAPGYPEKPQTGSPITLSTDASDLVFHAGTALAGGAEGQSPVLLTAGGRVLTVIGQGDTVELARAAAYESAKHVDFAGKHLRTDIAARWRD